MIRELERGVVMAQKMRLLLYIFVVSLCLHAHDIEVKSIQFESPFPDSPYRNVYKSCTIMWRRVRETALKKPSEDGLRSFNTVIIESLVFLHGDVNTMLENPRACSPDDIEHLIVVLHAMHGEYIDMQRMRPTEEAVCGAVLFSHIKNKLENALQKVTTSCS